MAAFARWTNLSETTFLLPPTDAGGRLPRAHLHARRRAALCRPPDAGQLPRLAGRRRRAAATPAWWCRNAASAWCASRRRRRRRRAGLRRAAAAAQRPARRAAGASASRGAGRARAATSLHHQWVDNGPGWCARDAAPAPRRCWRCKPDCAALADAQARRGRPRSPRGTTPTFEVRAFFPADGRQSKTRSPAASTPRWRSG